jgi:hypothetical protein
MLDVLKTGFQKEICTVLLEDLQKTTFILLFWVNRSIDCKGGHLTDNCFQDMGYLFICAEFSKLCECFVVIMSSPVALL